MQRFPPDANRRAERRTRQAQPSRETEQHREDEPTATIDWLTHIAAGRIPVPWLPPPLRTSANIRRYPCSHRARVRARRIVNFVTFRADLGADCGRRDVAGAGGRALGEIVGQLGVPRSGLFGNRALGFHPFLDGPPGVITRVRLHDPVPQSAAPKGLPPKATLPPHWLTNGYYPQHRAGVVPVRHNPRQKRDSGVIKTDYR